MPEQVDNLIKEDLDLIPVDPFTGDRLGLELTETFLTLYSIGADGERDEAERQKAERDDIVLQIPVR